MNKWHLVTIPALLTLLGCTTAQQTPRITRSHYVIIEAETPSTSARKGTHFWQIESVTFSESYLVAYPSMNTVFDRAKITDVAPSVHYRVDFDQPGTYYLWVRGKGEAGGASIIPGLNGTPITTNAEFVGFFPYEYTWLGSLGESGSAAKLEVAKPGSHIVDFWMLEDGFRFDKFLVTADSNYAPDK